MNTFFFLLAREVGGVTLWQTLYLLLYGFFYLLLFILFDIKALSPAQLGRLKYAAYV
jgi:hypothetical protein